MTFKLDLGNEFLVDSSLTPEEYQSNGRAPTSSSKPTLRMPPPGTKMGAWTPRKMLAAEHQRMWAAFFVAISCLLAALWFGYKKDQATQAVMQQTVFVIDGSGSVHYGPLESVANLNSPLYQNAALLATQATLQRSPVGLNLPEIATSLFNQKSFEKLKKDVEHQLPDIRARDLHQFPEISKIEALSDKKGTRLIRVEGMIVRSGVFGGVPISDQQKKFTIVFAFIPNPNLGQRQQSPLIVSDFRMQIQGEERVGG